MRMLCPTTSVAEEPQSLETTCWSMTTLMEPPVHSSAVRRRPLTSLEPTAVK